HDSLVVREQNRVAVERRRRGHHVLRLDPPLLLASRKIECIERAVATADIDTLAVGDDARPVAIPARRLLVRRYALRAAAIDLRAPALLAAALVEAVEKTAIGSQVDGIADHRRPRLDRLVGREF